MTAIYQRLYSEIKAHNPKAHSFCGPLAIAAVTELDIPGVLDYCQPYKAFGAKSRNHGMTGTAILEVIQGLTGHKPEDVTQKHGRMVRTPVTAEKYLTKGKYLAFTRNHVIAIIDGKVQDWTEGRKHRIQIIYKINT